jgi:hypothetical protein
VWQGQRRYAVSSIHYFQTSWSAKRDYETIVIDITGKGNDDARWPWQAIYWVRHANSREAHREHKRIAAAIADGSLDLSRARETMH